MTSFHTSYYYFAFSYPLNSLFINLRLYFIGISNENTSNHSLNDWYTKHVYYKISCSNAFVFSQYFILHSMKMYFQLKIKMEYARLCVRQIEDDMKSDIIKSNDAQ